MMVAEATGIGYEDLISGQYKLLIEPMVFFTYNGQYYAMTATEAALYDQMASGGLRSKMASLTHQNLPLALYLEYSDLGFPVWSGGASGRQSNTDIINALGLGIVWFDEVPDPPSIDAPDVQYRVDTDVITSITLSTGSRRTPDNPASVTFTIDGRRYRVDNIVIPAGDSQVVWVKWHTPSTPQRLMIYGFRSGQRRIHSPNHI